MGQPDALDRLAQVLILFAALFSLANAAFMVWDPNGWYQSIQTIHTTGPGNQHFIRDVGIAYLTCGIMLAYAVRFPSGRWIVALAGALWLSLHGVYHIWELFTVVGAKHDFWMDAPAVLGPPLMVLVALGILTARRRIAPAGLPKRIILGEVDKQAGDESRFFHEIADAPGHAFEKLLHFMPLTMHRYEAPADLFHVTRIAATLLEDCGPCALTAARSALADGVPRPLVNATLALRPLGGDRQVAFDFGQAIARQAAESATLGEVIQAKYGRMVRLELAMTAATVRAYPAVKRGLGLTTSCSLTKLEV